MGGLEDSSDLGERVLGGGERKGREEKKPLFAIGIESDMIMI